MVYYRLYFCTRANVEFPKSSIKRTPDTSMLEGHARTVCGEARAHAMREHRVYQHVRVVARQVVHCNHACIISAPRHQIGQSQY